MTYNLEDFRANGKISLSGRATFLEKTNGKNELEEQLRELSKELGKLQEKMYAHNRYSVLICLQGMDTSGKDSLIREVFSSMNPRGVVVHSFKTPNGNELEHDYLWRHYLALPERGKMAVFNRSHYENVLVTRVHPEYVLKENLPGIESVDDINENFWQRRFAQINAFEKHLSENGTIILKFYLHLSKQEQRKRLLRRLEEEKHNWKFSSGDLDERALWGRYMEYYEEAISRTSTTNAPWFVIPADDKRSARVLVAKTILERLKEFDDIENPELEPKVKAEIAKYRQMLESE